MEPTTDGGLAGRHMHVIGQDRSLAAIGRKCKSMEYKNHVPALAFADVAAAICEQVGGLALAGGIWLSLFAGQQSDRDVALRLRCRYVPVDAVPVVKAFGGRSANHVADIRQPGELRRVVLAAVGGEDGLDDIVLFAMGLPCETHSTTSVKRHRTAAGAAISDRAHEVDAMEREAMALYDELVARRAGSELSCTCTTRWWLH